MVPTKWGGELCPFRGVQHRPADGEHRSDTGEMTTQVNVCVQYAFVALQSKSVASFVKMWPDLFYYIRASESVTAASSPGYSSASQAAARFCALLYRVNKVSRVSVARGIGDKLMATSSPDKMHSFNGVFRPVGVYVFTLCLACSKEHLHSVPMLFSCFVRVWVCV